MMQLKHLFDDKELARDILSRWEHDPPGERFLGWFRISANAVYRFAAGGRPHFLRFAPEEETSADKILAELELIGYLRSRGYPANRPVPSTKAREMEVIDRPSGRYFAVVFEGVAGEPLDPVHMNDADFLGWGRALGGLHRLSRDFKPAAAQSSPSIRTWKS